MAKSKNDPSMRGKKVDVMYQGKKVVPILYVGENTRYMAVQFDGAGLAMDQFGEPIAWSAISN